MKTHTPPDRTHEGAVRPVLWRPGATIRSPASPRIRTSSLGPDPRVSCPRQVPPSRLGVSRPRPGGEGDHRAGGKPRKPGLLPPACPGIA